MSNKQDIIDALEGLLKSEDTYNHRDYDTLSNHIKNLVRESMTEVLYTFLHQSISEALSDTKHALNQNNVMSVWPTVDDIIVNIMKRTIDDIESNNIPDPKDVLNELLKQKELYSKFTALRKK